MIKIDSKADMLKSLLSKRSQDDTFPFTRDTLANSEIARISSMKNIIFVMTVILKNTTPLPENRVAHIFFFF